MSFCEVLLLVFLLIFNNIDINYHQVSEKSLKVEYKILILILIYNEVLALYVTEVPFM